MLDQAQMGRKNTHACTQASTSGVAFILKHKYKKNKQHKSDLNASLWSLFTFLQFSFYGCCFCLFAFRLFSPQVTSTMCGGTHGKGCVAFWQRGWSRCRGCECGRRSWRRSERSGWWLRVLWRSSSLCSAGAEGAGGPACWGTSLPSGPSRRTSVGGICTWHGVNINYARFSSWKIFNRNKIIVS